MDKRRSRQRTQRDKPPRQGWRWLSAGVVAIALLLLGTHAWATPTREELPSLFGRDGIQYTARAIEFEREPEDYGGLYAQIDGEIVAFPLQQTEVTADVAGNIARVEVRQSFTNPYDYPLEAIYQFPLPEDAAVDDMEIQIGDLVVRGEIKERQEAQQIYAEAKESGRTAALLEQERPNLFTQSLANIIPGETIDTVIRYTNTLKFEGGDYEFAFPMVVGPRYIPEDASGNVDFNRVPDVSRITPPMLPPEVRSGHDIGVTVTIDAGVPIRDVRSPSHAIDTENQNGAVRVQLADRNTIPNKDLILRYQIAGENTQATVLAQADDRGGHFASYLIPAIDYQLGEIVPKDVVFLIDTSGSQSGPPILQSKALMRQFIDRLNPDDTFSIVNFANESRALSRQPLDNTPQNRRRALAYINGLRADGGTELMNGIETVLNFPPARDSRLRSIVLLTDGLIGDDERVIGAVRDRLQRGNRIYTFGVGSATNRFLLERLAEVGRGKAEILPPAEPAEAVADKFVSTINNPVLTNIEVNWLGSGDIPEIYPQRPSDLFAKQPLVLHGRKPDGSSGRIEIVGNLASGETYRRELRVNFESGTGNPGIAQLWGRARIKDLMNQMYNRETDAGIQAVTQTALDYRLLSKYTAFVAVTETIRVDPSQPSVRQQVPVATPEGIQLRDNRNAHQPQFVYSSPEPLEILGNLLALLVLVVLLCKTQIVRKRSEMSSSTH
ncbi:VIT domain-containing protein [Synechococcus sp. PCC 7336]|uniref:VIT and vWA domain-containing protein n=1 Tax=Synechococcus sp. PCC 7336 TaxID=195250 RepID=UPI00034A76BD|nr:VIT domain-containing protein [Synechococcus sp. PCC 7336]